MNTLTKELKEYLVNEGASLVGVGDLSEIDCDVRNNMKYGISVALAIPKDVVKDIENGPTLEYYNCYHQLNDRLDNLVTNGANFLLDKGFEALPQTREVVNKTMERHKSMLPHKTVATRSGMGWIGKAALLVTKNFGSAVRISSILTNAPLVADKSVNKSKCGSCMACTTACPGQAVKGRNWSIGAKREDYYDPELCYKKAREIATRILNKEITLCGKCIYVCPYTQKYIGK